MSDVKCSICHAPSEFLLKKRLLEKHDVSYYKCTQCGFMQTEKPYWLDEAYGSVIAQADIGILERNLRLAGFVKQMLMRFFDVKGRFLDYAGGYGIYTRIMRDYGFNFYHDDPYCQNIYARFFSLDDLTNEEKEFELVTAFEMMEHLEYPKETVEKILSMSDSFFFTTELQPKQDLENWWYFVPVTGQHISFYTAESLEILANSLGAHFYTDGHTMHLITRQSFAENPLSLPKPASLGQKIVTKILAKAGLVKRNPVTVSSLLSADFENTVKRLKAQGNE